MGVQGGGGGTDISSMHKGPLYRSVLATLSFLIVASLLGVLH